jgi:hypothetical protein
MQGSKQAIGVLALLMSVTTTAMHLCYKHLAGRYVQLCCCVLTDAQ